MGIVIDLRGNSGGSLVEATQLTGLFIKSGPVVQIRDSRGRLQVNRDPDPEIAYSGPLAVIVDRRSASASEIFAAAIQDYRRGVIVGEPTFGKGTVQNLFDLDRRGGLGQLKVTIAQFFRVNGEGTQHRGVVPDIVLPIAEEDDEHGERALENALPWASVKPASFDPWSVSAAAYDFARVRHQSRVARDERFALLREAVGEQRKARESKSVSLVEAVRRQEWDERQQSNEARNDLYRKAIGIDTSPRRRRTDEQSPDGKPEKEREPAPDILLEEAAQILTDILAYNEKNAVGKMASSK